MRKNDAFRRAAALLAALSITVSLAAPAFAETYYYIDDGDITITKDTDGKQTVQQGSNAAKNIGDDEEIIITTRDQTITSLESDLEGPAAEDSGFGPVVEDNYQPAQPEDADQPESADQPENTDRSEDADQPESIEEPKAADRKESTEEPKSADRQESADQQPQQAAPAAAPAAPAPVNPKGNGVFGNIITVINNFADKALKLTLKDVKIDVSDTGDYDNDASGKAALSVQGEGNVEIELDGKNELKSGVYRAGLEKNTSKGKLTLKDDKEPGSGSLKATGGKYGAGIGGGQNGGNNITITGGTVNATGTDGGAGIGGGYGGPGGYGSGENITITGGTVNATGGASGAGIGGGYYGSGQNITITSGTVNATGGYWGAGIGGGSWGSGENITITGGTVNATGGEDGAGIGGGVESSGSNVTVSGAAQVTATAGESNGYYGAGATIGSGGSVEDGDLVNGKEIRADISRVTTGCIYHKIYEKYYDEDKGEYAYRVKQEWWEPERPQPAPDTPNAPAEESNEVSLGTPGLHVETLEGVLLPFDAQQQGSTLTVTANTLAARLHGTRQALETLQEQGVEQIQFVTTLKTTTLPVEDLLAEEGSRFALEHNGPVSRLLSAAQAESLECQMR